ncbi:MAG: VOC family protein [Fimbriimonadaceae bacterium]|nr:VOC family protein [Fimbriimonadaceae bacterium]
MLTGIHHAGITVSDLDRALTFYRDLLGLEVFVQMERTDHTIGDIVGYPGARIKIAFVGVPGDTARVELLQYVVPQGEALKPETFQPASGHVCFRADDIDGMYRRIAEAGYQPRSDAPVTITEGANKGARVFYVRDPDGYSVELFQPPPGR